MAEPYPTGPQVVDPLVETLSEVKCDTRELETMISRLGDIVGLPVSVPRYDTFHTSVVATMNEGRAPGEFNFPLGVAIHEDTHQIFVANQLNDRVEIFSETGEFLNQLGVGQLSDPWGIATHGDSLYNFIILRLRINLSYNDTNIPKIMHFCVGICIKPQI